MSNEYTREWWKERLPLIQAWAEGKKLQFKDGCDWLDSFDTCCFQSPLHMYRIAPKNNDEQSLVDFLIAELYDLMVDEARDRNVQVDEVLKEAIKRYEQQKEQQ